jgi:HSP20 family molecular chaperone IbpA
MSGGWRGDTEMAEEKSQVPTARAEGEVAERAEAMRAVPVFTPPADIKKTADGIVVELDMPSAEPESVNVTFEKRTLTVTARGRSTAPAGCSLTHAEYRDGDYERAFRVSDLIDGGKIEATYRTGVLKLLLPYSKETGAKTVKVKTA